VDFELDVTKIAQQMIDELEKKDPKKYNKVRKTLGLMQVNLRHQSLKTHKYNNYPGFEKQEVFESYVENKTPGAFRVFWCYSSSEKRVITILAITPHP
jgi:hypothetical protein